MVLANVTIAPRIEPVASNDNHDEIEPEANDDDHDEQVASDDNHEDVSVPGTSRTSQ